MQRRRHQVRRRLVGQLDDVLAQVGLENLNPLRLQHVIEPKFLGHHRLALGHRSNVVGARDLRHDGVGLRCVHREMHPPAGRSHVLLQHLQVVVQVPDGMFLDPTRLLPPFLPCFRGDLGDGLASCAVKASPGASQRLAELRILHRRLGRGHELSGNHLCHV